jgi:hypothetical protein
LSSLTWIDADRSDADRVRRVMALFKTTEARDELGLGSIRDTVADLLFPGTSTIQTHVRYMLFVPWMYSLVGGKASEAETDREIRHLEGRLINALKRSPADQRIGIIGVRAGENVQRLASEVYWGGLRAWDIVDLVGSRRDYHRLRANLEQQPWDSGLPKMPDRFPDRARFKLRREDAVYLRDKISMLSGPGRSYLHYVIDYGLAETSTPWSHPARNKCPPSIQGLIEHGRIFSAVMFGAVLLYNILLARTMRLENVRAYESDFNKWAKGKYEGCEFIAKDFENWDRSKFEEIAKHPAHKIRPQTWAFVDAWTAFAKDNRTRLLSNGKAEKLIVEREWELKDKYARLIEPEARKTWSGASAYAPLDYRWRRLTQFVFKDLCGGA